MKANQKALQKNGKNRILVKKSNSRGSAKEGCRKALLLPGGCARTRFPLELMVNRKIVVAGSNWGREAYPGKK